MNRRGFLGLALKGAVLGAALSTGLGRATLSIASTPVPADPLGQRGYVAGNYYTSVVVLNDHWTAVVHTDPTVDLLHPSDSPSGTGS